MAITNIVKLRNERVQFRGLFSNVIELEATWDPDNIASNGYFAEDITVQGVRFGDMCMVSFEEDLQNLSFEAHIKAANTVSLHLSNNTAGAVNLTANKVHLIVLRPIHNHQQA